MMRTFGKLFGRSPFVPLQTHMEKIAESMGLIPAVFEAYERGDQAGVEELAKQISKLEHQADLVKHSIRNDLPRGLFLPVDRGNLLRILHTQDGFANSAENIAVLLTFKQVRTLEGFREAFGAFVAKNLEAFDEAHAIVRELDELLESGFGGPEAKKVREMAEHVALKEYESDLMQRELLRELLRHEDDLTYGDFFIWSRLIREVSEISDKAEVLGNLIRTTLE